MKLLLKAGSSVNVLDKEKNSPLFFAAVKGNFRICEILLENGADPNLLNRSGETALIWAQKMYRFNKYDNYKQVIDMLEETQAK